MRCNSDKLMQRGGFALGKGPWATKGTAIRMKKMKTDSGIRGRYTRDGRIKILRRGESVVCKDSAPNLLSCPHSNIYSTEFNRRSWLIRLRNMESRWQLPGSRRVVVWPGPRRPGSHRGVGIGQNGVFESRQHATNIFHTRRNRSRKRSRNVMPPMVSSEADGFGRRDRRAGRRSKYLRPASPSEGRAS